MATYAQIYTRSKDGNIAAQIAVALTNEAKYNLDSTDADTLNWATYVAGNQRAEAERWQLMVCIDPAVADAESVRDEDIAASVTALVPTMVKEYKARTGATGVVR